MIAHELADYAKSYFFGTTGEHVIIDGKSHTAVLDAIESGNIDGEASGENADNDNLNKNDRDYRFDDPRIKNTDPKGTEK